MGYESLRVLGITFRDTADSRAGDLISSWSADPV